MRGGGGCAVIYLKGAAWGKATALLQASKPLWKGSCRNQRGWEGAEEVDCTVVSRKGQSPFTLHQEPLPRPFCPDSCMMVVLLPAFACC